MSRNVRDGVKWGLVMGALLSLWVAVLVPFNGSLTFRDRSGEGYHIGAIILLYILGGVVVGAMFGAMRPLVRYPVGAAVVGMLAMVPLGIALLISRIGFSAWTRIETISLIMMAIAVGGPAGLIVRTFVLDAEKRQRQ